jgi:glycosyltransferase involved in cell wall biosynthesis
MLLGPVPDDDLIPLYAGATAFALVSLYEGFGLTALEAMASGVPCVVSDVEGLAEAVGDSALLVDPRDEGAIEAGLLRVLNDDGLRASLRAKGLERARSLRWEDTAERVWNVCQSVGG